MCISPSLVGLNLLVHKHWLLHYSHVCIDFESSWCLSEVMETAGMPFDSVPLPVVTLPS